MKKALILAAAGGLFGGGALFAPDGASQGFLAVLALPLLFAAAAAAGRRAGEAIAPVVLLVSAAASAVHGLPVLLVGLQLTGALLLVPSLGARVEEASGEPSPRRSGKAG